MAGMLPFVHGSRGRFESWSPTFKTPETITFRPSQIILAIAFHLVDEGICASVRESSCVIASRKLSRRIKGLRIARLKWEGMTNSERLEWLLLRSQIEIMAAPDGSVTLSPR